MLGNFAICFELKKTRASLNRGPDDILRGTIALLKRGRNGIANIGGGRTRQRAPRWR